MAGVSVGWAIVLALVVIALATVAAYQNSFAGTFVLDDLNWIETNPNIRQLQPIWQVLFPANAPSVGGRPATLEEVVLGHLAAARRPRTAVATGEAA